MNAEIVPVATAEAIDRTALLARAIWREHYVPIIGTAQVEYMLDTFQSSAAIADQIDSGTDYFLLHDGEKDAGYMALVPETDAVKLSKLYVARAFRRRGIAATALAFIKTYCRSRGAGRLWLTVNKHNAAAIAWYDAMGFVNAGPIVQEIGNAFVMDDFLMEMSIA